MQDCHCQYFFLDIFFWKHLPRNHLSHGNTPNQAKQWQALALVLQESTIQIEIHSHHYLRIRSILLPLALQPAPGFLAVIIPTANQGVGTVRNNLKCHSTPLVKCSNVFIIMLSSGYDKFLRISEF